MLPEIDKKFSKYSYNFDLMESNYTENKCYAIYKQTCKESKAWARYEVQVVKWVDFPENWKLDKTKEYPEKTWSYPGKEMWGKIGWTFLNYEDANRKCHDLISKAEKK